MEAKDLCACEAQRFSDFCMFAIVRAHPVKLSVTLRRVLRLVQLWVDRGILSAQEARHVWPRCGLARC